MPVDAGLVKRTTASLLESADNLARRYVTGEARKAGGDDKVAARFDAAVRLPDASQKLLVDTSPEILEALGLDARTELNGGWCLAGINLPDGQITYHLPPSDWSLAVAAGIREEPIAPKWDGHKPDGVLIRLGRFIAPMLYPQKKRFGAVWAD